MKLMMENIYFSARGLDISHIKTVINYDIARDIDTHTHRIGRTGRAGEKGTAYTLVSEKDKEFAGHLVRNLEGANQEVPKDLLDLALQSSWFRKSRFKGGKGKSMNIGGAGLGFRERPESSNVKKFKKKKNESFVFELFLSLLCTFSERRIILIFIFASKRQKCDIEKIGKTWSW